MVILRKSVAGLSQAALSRFVKKAARAAGLKEQVSLLVTGNREMRSLNRRFRGKDRPTDVLSFPAEGNMGGLAGDIAISAEIAGRNARQLGHSPAVEIKVLVLHGILHLAGYDHESDQGEMGRREAALRRELGLPVGLIERHGARISSATMKRSPRTRPTR
ncbi:MAG: rRNA maturation RNase YbeY [Acidobacteria bacterium]|nr:rRNA maturation RNase YbeY [Acidobacteriota bacterium]